MLRHQAPSASYCLHYACHTKLVRDRVIVTKDLQSLAMIYWNACALGNAQVDERDDSILTPIQKHNCADAMPVCRLKLMFVLVLHR